MLRWNFSALEISSLWAGKLKIIQTALEEAGSVERSLVSGEEKDFSL